MLIGISTLLALLSIMLAGFGSLGSLTRSERDKLIDKLDWLETQTLPSAYHGDLRPGGGRYTREDVRELEKKASELKRQLYKMER